MIGHSIRKRLGLVRRPAALKESFPSSLPPLPAARLAVYDYYRLDFDTDGCPMRRMPDGRLVFHPILIPYIVSDYHNLYRKTQDPACLDYAREVMDMALNRAEPGRKELLFYYEPESGLTAMPHRFYSALTQSWYVKTLAHLERLHPGEYREHLACAFASLLIPIDQGGVLVRKDFGWLVEEYPHEPPLYTLNGWLTAIRWVLEALPELDKCNLDCREFLRRNLDAVEHLLPLYDAAFCWNTRYQLTGFTRLKIVTDRRAGLACGSFGIDVPGEALLQADLQSSSRSNRWQSHRERQDARLLQFNIVQSMISYPKANRYRAEIRCDQDCNATIFVADGDYDPALTAMPTTRWREIGRHALRSGTNQIDGDIPFDDRNIFAYPTNFKKKIGGRFYNAYHIVHVIDLAVLYAGTGRQIFADTAIKWLSYMDHWPEMTVLADPQTSKSSHVYGDDLPAVVERYLSKPVKQTL